MTTAQQAEQDLATVRSLVEQIRAHWADGCEQPGRCPSLPVIDAVADTRRMATVSLLIAALVALAQAPGNPAGSMEGTRT